MKIRKRQFEWYTWVGTIEQVRTLTVGGVACRIRTLPGVRYNAVRRAYERRAAIKRGQLILLPRVLGKSGKWLAA